MAPGSSETDEAGVSAVTVGGGAGGGSGGSEGAGRAGSGAGRGGSGRAAEATAPVGVGADRGGVDAQARSPPIDHNVQTRTQRPIHAHYVTHGVQSDTYICT